MFYYKINNILCLHFDSFHVKPSHRPPIVFYHLEWKKKTTKALLLLHNKLSSKIYCKTTDLKLPLITAEELAVRTVIVIDDFTHQSPFLGRQLLTLD